VVSHREVARDAAEAGLMRLVRTLALVMPSVALVQVLVNPRDYRQPAAAIVIWLAVLGAGAWLVPRLRADGLRADGLRAGGLRAGGLRAGGLRAGGLRAGGLSAGGLRAGGLSAGETAAAVLIMVSAVASIGAVHRAHGAPGGVDLAVLGTIWLLALVVMSHSARVWIPAALLVYAVQGAALIRDAGLNSLSLSQLMAAGYIITAVSIAFAVLRPTLDLRVSMAARQASLASSSAAESAAATAIQEERQGRLAVLEREALPLLRGIADGTLDPTEEGVREECARHATALRHSLTGGTPGGGELLAGLEPTLRAAADREMAVAVQVIGDPGTPRPPVARAVLAAVDAVISALPPHQVILTVLASGDDVELYLTFSAPLGTTPDLTRSGLDVPASACWLACVSTTETGEGCLEVSWRKDSAGGRTVLAEG
jgi:hypothetical protein